MVEVKPEINCRYLHFSLTAPDGPQSLFKVWWVSHNMETSGCRNCLLAAEDSQATSNQLFWFWPILKSSQIPRGCGGRNRHRLLLLQGKSTVCIHYLKSPQARREQAPWLLCWFESEMSPTGSWLGHLCYVGSVESLEMGAWLLKVNAQDRPLQLIRGR